MPTSIKKFKDPKDQGGSKEKDDSKSSSDDEPKWDMEQFDERELVRGDEDQRYLDSLSEFQRESILADRFEKLKNEIDMKKALNANK